MTEQPQHKPIRDDQVLTAMIMYGGSFVRYLGRAASFADADNLARIKATWPEYWTRYTEIANKDAQGDL